MTKTLAVTTSTHFALSIQNKTLDIRVTKLKLELETTNTQTFLKFHEIRRHAHLTLFGSRLHSNYQASTLLEVSTQSPPRLVIRSYL
jgi:hypothetical protein